MGIKLLVVSLALLASAVAAEEIVMDVSWQKIEEQGKLKAGRIVARDGMKMLEITNRTGKLLRANVLTIEKPDITRPTYAVFGQVAYKDVQGKGYLEMWNVFPDGSKYFSRTLADAGLLRYIEGSSNARPFVLPFFIGEKKERPVKLILNVVLPGRGTVLLGPLSLAQYKQGENPIQEPGAWWSERNAGLVGGSLGGFFGLLGATIGVLAGLGRARRFTVGLVWFTIVAGLGSFAVGLVALAESQPFAVWYPFLLVGFLDAVIAFVILPGVKRRYEQMELRRMQAQDLA